MGLWDTLSKAADKAVDGLQKTGGEMQICVSIAESFSNEEIKALLAGRGNIVMEFGRHGANEISSHIMKLALQKVATDRGLIN